MAIADDIKTALLKALKDVGISATEVPLEFPAELSHGDYATGVALAKAKEAGMNPRALAEKIVEGLGEIPGISKIEIAGPGFINFTLSSKAFAASVLEAQATDMWGSGGAKAGKKIMIEYTDPNPFKEFHIGHLVPNTIGESISRLFQFAGAEVKRANYQGDVGRHVARAIWGLMKSEESPEDVRALGRGYAAGALADVDDSPAKAEITAINKKVYDRSDATINDLYDRGRKTSLDHFEEIYQTLGTKFDFYFFESEAAPFGKKLVEENIGKVFKESDGAVVFEGDSRDSSLHTRVFLSSEGLPTYEAKELGLSKMKYDKFPYDLSVIVTGNEINEYFKVLLAAMKEIFPELAPKTKHISHGMMRFAEGKMSSRTGNVITGESLLVDLVVSAKERAAESRADDKEKLAEEVAVAAIKYQILRQASGKNIIFDREKALSIEGDSGPYVQYAHARTCAIVAKAKEAGVVAKADASIEPNTVTRLIPRFPEVVARSAMLLEPHLVTTYLQELASAFNAWYAQEHILDGTPATAHKVALVEAVSRTLKNGLWILGIPAPTKM
jgi:arginyl-tRNA synthetase